MKNVLLIVDPQNDFITGTLAVEGAEAAMKKLAEYINNVGEQYDYICVTMDSHTDNHMSFSENGGIWPKHCVIWSDGWDVPDYINDILNVHPHVACYHKGDTPDVEEYSIFDNWEDGLTLTQQLKHLLRDDEVYIDVCGIAGDYCVLETLKGLRKIVGDSYITVLTDFTASIDGGEKLTNYLLDNDINFTTDSSLNLTEYVR